MEENKREEEIKNAEALKYENIVLANNKLENKENTFLFLVTDTPNPAASIYEIYFHATVVKEMGYNVKILTDTPDFNKPDWIENELTDFEHISLTEVKLTVSPADVLVIPDIFSNVMEQTKNLPCIRVGLLQSMDYMTSALIPATSWESFGVTNVITTSNNLKEIFTSHYGNNYDIKIYKPGIPDYFKRDKDALQRPVISIIGRNPNDISKIVKLFYAKFPQYNWVGFDSMITESKPPKALTRKQFAERLKTNFASVWIDRISSFGTFPLEAMKAGSLPIGVVPDIVPEYLLEEKENGVLEYADNVGVWTNDIYTIPHYIGEILTRFLDDTLDDEIYEKMDEVSSRYSQEESRKTIQEAYGAFLAERKKLFDEAISDYKKLTEVEEKENK